MKECIGVVAGCSGDEVTRALKKRGYDVYSIGQHKGICKEPYVVIKHQGQQNFRINFTAETLDILFYYPFERYSEVMEYIDGVRRELAELNYLRPTGELTPMYIDDRKRAYMTSAKYKIIKRRLDDA